jgi:hypothetical protein
VQDFGPAFENELDFNVNNMEIEEDDHIFMTMVHLVNPHHFIHALSRVSGHLAEASAENSKPKGFYETVLITLHSYQDVFSETAFNALPQCWKWDHAIELEYKPSPGFRRVYLVAVTEQKEMDAFLKEVLATSCIRQSKSH